ncbi:MAG: hypothetical protein NVS1B11_04380 [Terriglobales bacterium]
MAPAKKSESDQDLIARAEAAKGDDQPPLYIELAERRLEAAHELFHEGKVGEARTAVNEIVTYSQKAHDAAAASNKKLKNTEIAFRKMALKLRDIKRTLNYEDQPPLQSAEDRLEGFRTDLLSHMFPKVHK